MAIELPFVYALCPTFRHPKLLANSLALWLCQSYPLDRRYLLILDDDPTFHATEKVGWQLMTSPTRLPSICAKYNQLLNAVPDNGEDSVILVWEDDDIYLPGYVAAHVEALRRCPFSKPNIVLSDYGGTVHREGAAGRFHSSMAFLRSLIKRVGGWPSTKRADFDQQLIHALHDAAGDMATPWPNDAPEKDIQFIYRWHTGAAHCQSTMDRGQADETWYDRGEQAYARVPFVGTLVPCFDEFTMAMLRRE